MTSWTRTVGVSFAVLVLAAAGCASPEPVPGPTANATTPGTPGSPQSPTPDGQPSPRPDIVVVATVSGGAVQTDSERVEVELGKTVRLVVRSDADDELHVHGYELKHPVIAGEELTLEFVADIPGVFEVELEETGLHLFELRVR